MSVDPPSIKRPDGSWKLVLSRLPHPPPAWIVILPFGAACPNVVLEVAVNNESFCTLISDSHRYFTPHTSVTVWIGVKVYVDSQRFWVGWAERAPDGTGAVLHTEMPFPPTRCRRYTEPVGVVYHIPMQTVFGVGIPVPAELGDTLDIDVDQIAQSITLL
jgi:hypothetical protein